MCYLVAKDRNEHGCYALKTTHGRIKKGTESSCWL